MIWAIYFFAALGAATLASAIVVPVLRMSDLSERYSFIASIFRVSEFLLESYLSGGRLMDTLYRQRSATIRPPGHRLLKLAEMFYSQKTYKGVFEPLLADWQNEYLEVLAAGRTRKCRLMRLQLAYYFASTVVEHACDSTLGRILRSIVGFK